jgi:zinc transport system substrate-binding protein
MHEAVILQKKGILMKKPYSFVITILVLSLIATSFLGACSPATTSKLKVVTSTSLLASIVERVGGDRVNVVNIIPPAQCPGHFDVKPGDIQKLADTDLFLLHGWQGEMFAQEIIVSVNNPNLNVAKIDIKGNWMTPSVQLAAIDEITITLGQVDAKNSAAYQEATAEYKDEIEAKKDEVEAKLAKEDLTSINVMCSDQLSGFIQWTGLNIVDIYGRPDSLTPQAIKELVDKGREAKVTLIIDNLQSGKYAGAGIAEELGCKRVTLSNFPGGFENTETWEKAIDRNIELLLEVIAQ